MALTENSIGGPLTADGVSSCMFIVVYNTVHGSATVSGNTVLNGGYRYLEAVGNNVSGTLTCSHNSPVVSFDGSYLISPNTVAGDARGECSFGTISLNPDGVSGGPSPISERP